MAIQLFNAFALLSIVQAVSAEQDRFGIGFDELGEVYLPCSAMEEDAHEECIEKMRPLHHRRVQEVASSREALEADWETREQIVECTILDITADRLECISNHAIYAAFLPGPDNYDFTYFVAAIDFQSGHKNHPSYQDASREVYKARMKLLEGASQEREYFRSHIAAFKKLEAKRIQWQCKNLSKKW